MQKQTKMLQFRRTFENEQIQLRDLNTRLKQYLARVSELEQDNALLITEINTIRQDRTVEWEKRYMTELRELRRTVNQLTLEKSKAEMEREKLGREFQAIQALCYEEAEIYRGIEGERKSCEKQLQQALKKNAALEKRLLELENEYMCLENAHIQDITHLHNEVHSRAKPVVITQNYQGHPAVTMEEIEEYAHKMSESLNENFEVYCRRIDDLENSIKANQAKLEDLEQEKTQYVSELKKLHGEAHKQNKLQLHLEDQITQMQDRFNLEIDRYQLIIGELEEEHRATAHAIAEKLQEYQQLMQVKMGLSLEVATYRALLEGERKDPIQKMDQYGRETSRRIDIKMPAQPWSTTRQEVRKQYPPSTGPETRYMDLASSLKSSFGSTSIRSTSPAKVIPISIYGRDQKGTPARRDMPSFTNSSQATTHVQKSTVEERIVRSKEPSQKPVKDSANRHQPGFSIRPSPEPALTNGKTTVVTTSTESTVVANAEGVTKHDLRGLKADKTEGREEKDGKKVTVQEWKTPDWEDVRSSNVPERLEVQSETAEEAGSCERLPGATNVQKIIVEERSVTTKELLQKPANDSASQHQQGFATRPSPEPALMKGKITVITTSTESSVENARGDSKHDLKGQKVDKTEHREEKEEMKVTVKDSTTPDWGDLRTGNVSETSEVQSDTPVEAGSVKKPQGTTNVQKIIMEDRSVRTKGPLQRPAKPCFATIPSPGPALIKDETTVITTSTQSTVVMNAKGDTKHDLQGLKSDQTGGREEKDANKVTVKEWTTPDREDVRTSKIPESLSILSDDPEEAGSSDEKMVDYIYMEEIIEKVMKPAGLDTKFISPSPDSKVAYRVEKTEDEDGTTKTQIILESRMQEDVDISDDFALEELLSKGVTKVALDDIKGTPTGSAIENLLSLGHHGGAADLKNKSVNVEIIEEPAEDHVDEEGEANPAPTFFQPSSMFFQIEELDGDSRGAKLPGGKTEVSKPTPTEESEYHKEGSVWVEEGDKEADDAYSSHALETEYFVSTPDESISESEEERGISSSGHYGVVDDLSDERYYQEVPSINPRFEEDKGYRSGHRISYMTSEFGFTKDRFPECIIEEEVQVSPTVQESMLELLTEDSMDPEHQLRGTLDKLQGNVSESLQDELSYVTKNVHGGFENVCVDVKKVQEVSDNKTAITEDELRDLEDSDLLEDSEADKQALASSHLGLQHVPGSKTVREYTVKIVRDQDVEHQSTMPTAGLDGSGLEGYHVEEPADDFQKTERVIRLGPSERSLMFQMDIGNLGSATSQLAEGGAQEFHGFFSQSQGAGGPSGGEGREGVYSYVRKTTVSYDQGAEPTYDYSHEKEATYLPAQGGAQEFHGFFSQSQGTGEPSGSEGREGMYSYVRKTTVSYDQGDEPVYGHGHEGEAKKWDNLTKQQVEYSRGLQSQFLDPQLKVSQEKKIATVYLDSVEDN